jgi:hypothetical protein
LADRQSVEFPRVRIPASPVFFHRKNRDGMTTRWADEFPINFVERVVW